MNNDLESGITAAASAESSNSQEDGQSYGIMEYWDQRYRNGAIGDAPVLGEEPSNEWYLSYANLKEAITANIPKSASVLMLGCGLSTLGEHMCNDGYHSITAIDYSPNCIERMSFESSIRGSNVKYRVMDVTKLDFADCSWDCVLDKATLDALICVDEEEDETVQQMLDETWRVLKPGGRYVCISNSNCKDLILTRNDDVDIDTTHCTGNTTDPSIHDGVDTNKVSGKNLQEGRCFHLFAEERFKHKERKQKFWMGVFVK